VAADFGGTLVELVVVVAILVAVGDLLGLLLEEVRVRDGREGGRLVDDRGVVDLLVDGRGVVDGGGLDSLPLDDRLNWGQLCSTGRDARRASATRP